MYLHGEVKYREGVDVLPKVLPDVFQFLFGYIIFMFLDPLLEDAFES